jgi:hypothetical protein
VVVVAAAQHRLASLRLARWGSLLVRREALDRHGPPLDDLGGAEDLDWTARILREGHGYLAPRSIVERPLPSEPAQLSPGEVSGRVRMVRGDAWVAHEPVWFAFMLGVDALRELSSTRRPATAARVLRGVAAGLAAGPPRA